MFASTRFVAIALAASLPALLHAAGDSVDLARIGERLFADKRLSIDGSLSCASCHIPEKAFADGRAVPLGLRAQPGVRNTPSLMTAESEKSFSWDGRHSSLESQVIAPLVNPREHAFASHEQAVEVIKRAGDYPAEFRRDLTVEKLAKVLAAYLRSLGGQTSRFDRYWFAKDRRALSEEERRGMEIFRGPGRCASCHELTETTATFTDGSFHAVGMAQAKLGQDLASLAMRSANAKPAELETLITSDSAVAALGRFNVTRKPADIGKYRTPSLRNVAITAPYMHDGSVATLEEAVELEIYYRAIEQGRPLLLTPAEKRNLVAFLRALTSETYEQAQGRQ